MSGSKPLVVNGWAHFAHPIFLDQLDALTAQVEALKRKAGMPADFWSAEMRVSRYTVSKWHQAEFASELAADEAKR